MNKLFCLLFAACIIVSLAACTQNLLSSSSTLEINTQANYESTCTPTTFPQNITQEDASAIYQAPLSALSLPIKLEVLEDPQRNILATYEYQTISLFLPDADVAEAVASDLSTRISSTENTAESVFSSAKANYSGQSDWYPYSCTVAYQPMRFDENILSLLGDQVSFDGGPRNAHTSVSVTYDLTTGKTLSLSTIFHEENFADALCDMILEGLISKKTELFNDYEATVRSLFSTNMPIINWYFSDDGLCFFFSPYEIAPYTCGTITSLIPYNKLSGLLKDAYFPSEQLLYSGEPAVISLEDNSIPETLSQFAELPLCDEGRKILITSAGSIANVRICYDYTTDASVLDETIVLAMPGIGPNDAILLKLDEDSYEKQLSIHFVANGVQQTRWLTLSSSGEWQLSE